MITANDSRTFASAGGSAADQLSAALASAMIAVNG